MAFNEQLNTKEDGLKEYYMKIPFENESNCSISIERFSPIIVMQTNDIHLKKHNWKLQSKSARHAFTMLFGLAMI